MAGTAAAPVTSNVIHQGTQSLIEPILNPPGTGGVVAPTDRKGLVDTLIAGGGWSEDDRMFLTTVPDSQFGKLKMGAGTPTPTPTPVVPAPVPTIPAVQPAQNAAQPQTMNQFIANAPPEYRDVLTEMQRTHEAEKQNLVRVIVSNKLNRFPQTWLEQQGINMLRGMASLAVTGQPAQPVANGGSSYDAPLMFGNGLAGLTGNQGQPAIGPALEMPNWDEVK